MIRRSFWLLPLAAAALHAQSIHGLVGNFTDGTHRAHFVAASPNFYLEPNESIHPSLAAVFRGEWSGSLQVLESAEFEFNFSIVIDGTAAIRHKLAAGTHHLVIPYERTSGAATLRLQWRSPAFDWEPIPRTAYSHDKREEPADGVEEGRALVYSAGCANCHRAAGMERPVPSLAGIGSRTNAKWLYAWLDRHQVISHTAAQGADLTAHLMTQISPAPSKARARRGGGVSTGKGGELFGTLGCVNCHPLSRTLTSIGSKYTLPVLTELLGDRHQPSMLLSEDDAAALAAYLATTTDAEFEKTPPPGDAARGAALLTSLSCLGCHEQRAAAKSLGEIRSATCRVVRTTWTQSEQQAATAFLAGPADRSPAPVYELTLNLRRMKCLACHTPGTEAPSLEGVGEKLRTSWIGGVLWGKQRIRPSRELRMPHYTESLIRPWVGSFAKAEGLAPGDGPAAPSFTGDKPQAGIGLLGTNPKKSGMACIGCHDWGQHKSLGEEGPQLVNAALRLRFDWFERWMRNPARILSGTSMPAYFTSAPRDRATETIHTLWAGLALGAKAPIPDGYRVTDLEASNEAKPVPAKEAIVVRWDMPEATPAAIAVGLPGRLSYCFDAGESRLLYAWRGGFVDMTGTLLRKTNANKLTPTAGIVGEIFWRSAAYPIRIGAGDRIPQRRFKGYRLLNGTPQFHYQVDGIDVYEQLTPLPAANAIRREITFSRVDQPIQFEGRPVPRGTNVKVEVTLAK